MNVPYSLRGDGPKKKFLDTHQVCCVEHSALFPGKIKKCCCGTEFEGEYYCFSYGDDQKQQFYAGSFCGKTILDIGKLLAPPACDPFGLLAGNARHGSANARSGIAAYTALPENREMIRAVTLLLYLWSNKEGYLSRIRDELQQNPQMQVENSQIRSLNKAICTTARNRDSQGANLREMIEEIGVDNGLRVKKIRFPYLEARLQNIGEDSKL